MIHDYGEPLEAELQVYSPTEVVAEKLRATRQQLARLENRGWMRNRARDYYDLWRVLGHYWDRLNLVDFRAHLHDKCRLRNVDFEKAPRIPSTSVSWTMWNGVGRILLAR